MVSSIKDPDALAEEVCRVNIISPVKKDVVSFFADIKGQTCSLLQFIEEMIKRQPMCFRLFLSVLESSPDLSQLASVLQCSYGEFF